MTIPALWLFACLCCLLEGQPTPPAGRPPETAADTAPNLGQQLRDATIWVADPAASEGSVVAGFRREFSLDAAPDRAELSLFGYTRYMLFINGAYVGRGPNRFENRRPEYDTWDIAARLRPGRNVIAVQVHRDWTADAAGFARMMAHPPGFSAAIRLKAADGSARDILTDEQWAAVQDRAYGPPRGRMYASIPESIDLRNAGADWRALDFDASALPRAARVNVGDTAQWPELAPRTIPLLRETPLAFETIADPAVTTASGKYTLTKDQTLTLRLPRTAQAYPVLEVEGEPGSVIVTSAAGFRTMGSNSLTLGSGPHRWIGSDTFAVRDLVIKVNKGRATIKPVALVEVLYPFDLVGKFGSSDPLLDRIWTITARSTLLFSEDAYVDCADRERSEWMDCDPPIFDATRVMMAGPAAAPGGAPTWGDARLLKNMVLRVGLSQVESGMTKARTCSDRMDVHTFMEDRACQWVQGIRKYYEATGDAEHVRLVWPFVTRQLQWFLDRRQPSGLVRAREWVVWDNPMRYLTGEGTALNAFVYRALADAAYLAERIGMPDDAARFAREADALREAFNRVLWNETLGAYHAGHGAFEILPGDQRMRRDMGLKIENDLVEPTAHANLFAIDRGIVPPERLKRVVDYIQANDRRLGEIMAHHYYTRLLYDLDTAEADARVLELIRAGWTAMADHPDQTTWEKMTSGSKSHVYGIVPGHTLSTYVLGVRRDAPVWQRQLVIDPRLADLQSASGVVVTEFGPVAVAWNKSMSPQGQTNKLTFSVDIPTGVTAKLRLADALLDTLTFDQGGSIKPATVVGRSVELALPAGTHHGSVSISKQSGKD
jgi:hypothetical protein